MLQQVCRSPGQLYSPTRFRGTCTESSENSRNLLACLQASGVCGGDKEQYMGGNSNLHCWHSTPKSDGAAEGPLHLGVGVRMGQSTAPDPHHTGSLSPAFRHLCSSIALGDSLKTFGGPRALAPSPHFQRDGSSEVLLHYPTYSMASAGLKGCGVLKKRQFFSHF